MSLTNTLASLALGVATETGSGLLEDTFDAATSGLTSSGHELASDAQNPRHALEQRHPKTRIIDTRVIDTRFLARAPLLPLAKPAQDLALAGIGAAWQDPVRMDLVEDITLPIMREVLDWAGTDSDLRFYGEPLLLLTLLGGGVVLTGLGLGAVALRTLTRKPAKTNRPPARAETPQNLEANPDASGTSAPSFTESLDRVLADKGIAIPEGETPPEEEDRATEAGGVLDVDPPSRADADPPTRVSVTIDEVPVNGALTDLGAPPLSGEASGVAALPFGPTPAPRAEAIEGEFVLPAPDEDGDIEIDLSGLSDSVASDTAVEDNSGAAILLVGEEAPDGLEADPAETTVQVGPIIVIEAPFSQSPPELSFDLGTFPAATIEDGSEHTDATGELRRTDPPPRHTKPTTVQRGGALGHQDGNDLASESDDSTDEVPKVAGASGEGTDPGSERQRDQLQEEVLADSGARAPVASPVSVAQPVAELPRFLPPEEPAEPASTEPVRAVSPPPVVIQRRVTPLPDALDPLPVAVGPAPAEPRPVRPVPPRPFISPTPPPPEPAPGGTVVTLPAPLLPTPRPMPVPKPTPSYWEQGVTWLLGMWNVLKRRVGPRVEMAELPAADPLVYNGPVMDSKYREPMRLRVPLLDQQIKDRDTVRLPRGAYWIDLKSRPLQHFLEKTFPYGALSQSLQIVDEITERYHTLLTTPNSFTRVADDEVNNRSYSVDKMITDGLLRNRDFAAVMMQLSLERMGIYSEIVIGVISRGSWGEKITAIAIYQSGSYRGTPTRLIDVTNVHIENPSHFTPDPTDWLPRPSKRGK